MDSKAEWRPPIERVGEVRAMSERIIGIARPVAAACGYAICVHGSLERDVDLLAVPWVDDAADATDLAKAIQAAVSAEIGDCYRSKPELKPHGRVAWIMYFQGAVETTKGAYPFIDLSVMPRALTTVSPAALAPHP